MPLSPNTVWERVGPPHMKVMKVREHAFLCTDGYLLIINDLPVRNFSHPLDALEYLKSEWGLTDADLVAHPPP